MKQMSQNHAGLLLIITAFTLISLLYDVTVPMFEKPDELKHFAVIQHIHAYHQLPIVESGIYRPYDQEGTQPPLYYLLAALLTSWLDLTNFEEPPRNPHYVDDRSFVWYERGNNNLYLHSPTENWSTDPIYQAARLSRWLSLICGWITIGLTYKLARLIFQSDSNLSLLAIAFVAFVPQFMHSSTAITNDSLSTTLAVASLLILALIIQQGRATRYNILLGILLGLGALTKLSLLYMLPLVALVYAGDVWRQWQYHNQPLPHLIKTLLIDALIVSSLMLIIAGWWFWRNWQLYGDVSALNAHLLYRGGPLNPTPTLYQLWQTELTGLELTFWGAFGAGQILFEPYLYTFLQSLKYIVVAGISLGVIRVFKDQFKAQPTHPLQIQYPQLAILMFLLFWVVIIFAALLRWMQITPASWGRLLFPTLPAIAILTVWGLSQFYIARWPISRYLFPMMVVSGLLAIAFISPFRYTYATYNKTPLISETELPTELFERLDFTYNDELRLIGYQVDPTTKQPAEWVPITLYWQALKPIKKDYSVFVHFMATQPNGRLLKVGESNSYPDRGNWPTSLLPVDGILVDRHYLHISPQTTTPAIMRVAMGLFEFTDPQRIAKLMVNQAGETVEPLIGTIPLEPSQWPTLAPEYPMTINFADQIQLLGYDIQSNKLTPQDSKTLKGLASNETITVTLHWQTLNPPQQDLTLFIQLLDATQTQIAGYDAPPYYPISFWQAGTTLTDTRIITLPPNLSSGDYRLLIGWYHPKTFDRLSWATLDGEFGDALPLLTITNQE